MDTDILANNMGTFASRHIGPQADERDTMLAAVGAADLDDLVAAVAADVHHRDRAAATATAADRVPGAGPAASAWRPRTDPAGR